MSTDIRITVEDVTTQMLTYTSIQLESSATVGGTYTNITTLTLVALTYYYSYTHSAGDLTTWYRWRFYNATGPVTSSYSNPFQAAGATRLRIRQKALDDYGGGQVILAASSGQAAGVPTFSTYKVQSSAYRTDRGKGSWLYPTSGSRAGEVVRVTASSPSSSPATMTINPAFSGVLATSDEVEWHWLVGPDEWNLAINRAMRRYMYLERTPLVGLGTPEIALTMLPWLTSKLQLTGLWWYPSTTTSIEQPWGQEGRWWNTRQEAGYLTLITSPTLATTDTVYVEALRPMPEVYTDASALPTSCNIELAAGLAYDEVLAWLAHPNQGAAAVDRAAWKEERMTHNRQRLHTLWKMYGPRPRLQRGQFSQPAVVPAPFVAR